MFDEKIKPKLLTILKFLGDKNWLLGYLTFADFRFQELVHFVKHLFPKHFCNIGKAYLERFEALPGIKEFYAKAENANLPFVPTNFGNWPKWLFIKKKIILVILLFLFT